jgi:peptidoglycan-associated lipoprotein
VAPIQFAFDRSDLTLDARSALDAKLEVLRADPAIRLRIDGHADERGSSEYNLALGMRRAAAARRYLVQREIAPDRIEITSLGEERPVCETSAEWCWRINRRDDFAVTAP